MKKLVALLCALSVMGGLFANGSKEASSGASNGASDKNYTLMFGHTLTENDPYQKAFLKWAEAVKERTNGHVIIDVYANAQLGSEEDVIEQMRTGANIGWNTDSAVLATMSRVFPFLMDLIVWKVLMT